MRTIKATVLKILGSCTKIAMFLFLFSICLNAQTVTQVEELWKAMQAKDLTKALALVHNINSVNYMKANGLSLLMGAAWNGYAEVCRILIEKGADLDLQTSEGTTALSYASQEGHPEVVKLLLEKGANPDLKATKGKTALIFACSHISSESQRLRYREIVKLLLDNGANTDIQDNSGWTALMHSSSGFGNADNVILLLEKGANLDIKDNYGSTALTMARYNKKIEYLLNNIKAKEAAPPQAEKLWKALQEKDLTNASTLVQHIDAVNYMDSYGNSLLTCASKNGYGEVCRLLLDKGAKLDWQTIDGLTALVIASQEGHSEVVKLLLEKGASVDLQTNKMETALYMASKKGHSEVVNLLLEKGANTDIQELSSQETALSMASKEGHSEVVNLLLEKGASVDLQARNGETALMWASDNGHIEVVKLLLDKGAKPDIKNRGIDSTEYQGDYRNPLQMRAVTATTLRGNTALMIAAKSGHIEVVKLLLDKGANPDLKDDTGRTALDYAKNPEIKALITTYIKK